MTSSDAPNGVLVSHAAPAQPEEHLSPVFVHLVRCEPVDTSEITNACRLLGANAVGVEDAEAWLESVSNERTPPDLVVLAGRAETLLAGEWIRRASQRSDSAGIAVAAVGATVEHAAGFMTQGASGLLLLPGSAESFAAGLQPLYATALGSREQRRRRADLRRCMQTITRGEAEVLQSLLAGAANKQIAQKLGIGLRTVELRRSKVMKKMNAASVSQLVLHVAEAGVDRVPPLLLGRRRAPRS